MTNTINTIRKSVCNLNSFLDCLMFLFAFTSIRYSIVSDWVKTFRPAYRREPSRLQGISAFYLLTVGLLCLTIISTVGSAATYYLDAVNGDDSNPGTLTNPWKTIGKANIELQAGDSVLIREGNYQETIKPSSSGTAGNYITYKSYQNEQVILSHGTGRNYVIYLDNKSYILIDSITIDGYENGYPDVAPNIQGWVKIESGGNNIIQNCKMQYSGTQWSGFWIKSSNYNKILNNILHHHGTFVRRDWDWHPTSDGDTSRDDWGDCIRIWDSNYNLVEGNDISYGGHALLGLTGNYNVIRNNYFHNRWEKCLDIEYYSVDGYECKYNLFENNIIAFAYETNDAGTVANPGMQCSAIHMIIRNNRFYENAGEAIWVDNYSGCLYSRGHRIYNNVFYRNGHHDMNDVPHAYGFMFAHWAGEPIVDNVLINNIFWDNYLGSIEFWHNSVDADKQVVENNHSDDDSDPLFVNADNYDFHLKAGSPCIDAGRYLTTTIGSGSGVILSVKDAGYFCDGFGIIKGDQIQLAGQTKIARITNVNYDNNIITVDTPLTWQSGQGVSIAYSGSAPDIGAYEYSASTFLNGDVSENSTISAYDAALIAQLVSRAFRKWKSRKSTYVCQLNYYHVFQSCTTSLIFLV